MDSGDAADTVFVEARLFGGVQARTFDRVMEGPSLAAGGVGLRFGLDLGCTSGRYTWGPEPEAELRLELCSARDGVRVAGGVVLSRDVLRGEPRWLEGVGFTLDVEMFEGKGPIVGEFFVSAAILEDYVPQWTPDRGIATSTWGFRLWRRSLALEFRGEYRFAYDDVSMFGMYVGVVVRDRPQSD